MERFRRGASHRPGSDWPGSRGIAFIRSEPDERGFALIHKSPVTRAAPVMEKGSGFQFLGFLGLPLKTGTLGGLCARARGFKAVPK